MSEVPIRISVVIPAYNAAHFLPRSVRSAFAQTLKPIEVIVVDDGSTDDTAAVAAQLGATVIRQPNSGQSAARNAAIRRATGTWIALLDADDLWEPAKLERQATCIREDTVLVYTGVRVFDDSGTRSEQTAIEPASARKMLRYCNTITASSVLAKRDALIRDGGFRLDVHGCEDWDMWYRLMGMGQFAAVPEALTGYYVYPDSHSASPERMLQALHAIIDSTLLTDLHGFDRALWRRRIRATQLASAGLIARDNGLRTELYYMARSIGAWPSPLWQPKRFATLAVSLRNSLFRR